MARPSDPDENDRDDKHLKPHPDHPIADKPGRPHPEHPIADDDPRRHPGAHPDNPLPTEKPKPKRAVKTEESDIVRVILTGDNRGVYTEAWVPAADYGFRIFVDGQHFEQIGEADASGTRVFAPTR